MNERYRVTLTAKGPSRVHYVRALRFAFPVPIGLKEAFDFADQVDPPFVLMEGVGRVTAEQALRSLREGGADGQMDSSDYPVPMRYYRPDLDRKPTGCLFTLFSGLRRKRRQSEDPRQ